MQGVQLIEGDCFDILPGMDDGCVDAIITDPPYSATIHAGARTTRPGVGLVTEKLISFASITTEQFLAFCWEAVRVARRWVVMTCDWRHATAAEQAGLPVVRVGVWIKPDAAPQFTGDRPGTGWEAVLILHRAGKKRWNNGGHHAVWTVPVEREGLHPTQKPYRLVRDWMRAFTDEGEVVLDPFAGSGQVGLVAVQSDRRAILIEREPAYCEIIRRRLANHEPLFAGGQ